jgi:hypothetical protein
MNFDKAHKELLSGKKVRRKEWEPLMHLRLIEGKVKAYKGENISFYTDSNILLSTGWKVIDGDGSVLTFLEALEELKQKKHVKMENMEDAFIFVDNGQFAMCRQVEYEFMPTFKCLCSNDWEIIK